MKTLAQLFSRSYYISMEGETLYSTCLEWHETFIDLDVEGAAIDFSVLDYMR